MSLELLVAGAALIVALAGIGLQLFHMRRDPNVPELGDDRETFGSDDSWTAA